MSQNQSLGGRYITDQSGTPRAAGAYVTTDGALAAPANGYVTSATAVPSATPVYGLYTTSEARFPHDGADTNAFETPTAARAL